LLHLHIETDPLFTAPNKDQCFSILEIIFQDHNIQNGEVSIIFAQDELLANLKKEFFKVDQLTDVIAFRLNEYSEPNIEGELYISLPRAEENAKTYKEPFEREVARLIIHGSLHLLNYDDQTDEESEQMRQMEETYLQKTHWKGLLS